MLYLQFLKAQFNHSERGAGMAEYALLLALIAVALIIGFGDLATAIDGVLTKVGAALDAAGVA